eukprot:16351189-Heterocapsa_arctica.AAC.1
MDKPPGGRKPQGSVAVDQAVTQPRRPLHRHSVENSRPGSCNGETEAGGQAVTLPRRCADPLREASTNENHY